MSGGAEMRGRVLAGRGIAATDIAAGLADAQLNPFLAEALAFRATFTAWLWVLSSQITVGTLFRHGSSLNEKARRSGPFSF
jgi:hypothetical protein